MDMEGGMASHGAVRTHTQHLSVYLAILFMRTVPGAPKPLQYQISLITDHHVDSIKNKFEIL